MGFAIGRLKVLFIVAWYPTREQPVNGIFLREQARAVQKYDDVTVLHCAGAGFAGTGLSKLERETDETLTEGIPTYRVRHRPPPGGNRPVQKVVRNVFDTYSVVEAFRRLRSEGLRPDLIHGHVFSAGFPAGLIGKLYGLPVVVSEHYGGFPLRQLSRGEVFKARWTCRLARRVLPVSASLEKAMKAYGIRARFQIVPNVVNTGIFNPDGIRSHPENSLKKILFVGLLHPDFDKGVADLFQALAGLRKKREDWHLDLVGDGPARAGDEVIASNLKLADKVTFRGIKTREEVADYMRQADFFVLPSLGETFGLAIAEALACGKPVIATRCGGPEEFVTPEAGILIPSRDPRALEEAIGYMLDNYRNYPGEKIARSVRERFSPEVVGAKLDQIYREVLG